MECYKNLLTGGKRLRTLKLMYDPMNINWEILYKGLHTEDLYEVCPTGSQISKRSTFANPGHFIQTYHFKP
jgi:hypothetical protein